MSNSILIVTVYAWIGWVVSTAFLGVLFVLSGYVGVRVFKRIRRIYSLTVIGYWLQRFEREGLRTFERASDNE